jgi:hypothetical protein
MTKVVQIIKQKIQDLPKLHLPDVSLPLIIETDASNETWATVLLQKSSARQEEVCIYASGCFSDTESKYPSSHKEILAVKNGIKKFRLFLKPVHFTVRTDLKHMKGMLSNQRLLEQGNNRILRWSLWLDGFDFDIQYKPGKDNCIADLLTREAAPAPQAVREIKMMASSSQIIPTLLLQDLNGSYCVTIVDIATVLIVWSIVSNPVLL